MRCTGPRLASIIADDELGLIGEREGVPTMPGYRSVRADEVGSPECETRCQRRSKFSPLAALGARAVQRDDDGSLRRRRLGRMRLRSLYAASLENGVRSC